jgi:hypothetical protein
VPTFGRLPRFDRESRPIPSQPLQAFLAMPPVLTAAAASSAPLPAGAGSEVRATLRPLWEITLEAHRPAGIHLPRRARPGEAHVIWRRVGTYDALSDPQPPTAKTVVPNHVPSSPILTRSNCTELHSEARTYDKCPANAQLLSPRLEVRVLHGPSRSPANPILISGLHVPLAVHSIQPGG